MNLIHRHIFAKGLLACAAAVTMFGYGLMIGSAMRDLPGPILAGQIAINSFFQLVSVLIPFALCYALPMDTRILLVLGRMSSVRTITALRFSGVSVSWLSMPIIFLALLGVVASQLICFQFRPLAGLAYQREFAEVMHQNPLSSIVAQTFSRDFSGKVIYVGGNKAHELFDGRVWELDKQARAQVVYRAQGKKLIFHEKENTLELIGHELAIKYRDARDPEIFSGPSKGMGYFENFPWTMPLARIAGANIVQKEHKWFTFPQLMAGWTLPRRPDPAAADDQEAKLLMGEQVTIQEKWATSCSALSYALVAVPLGIRVSHKAPPSLSLGLFTKATTLEAPEQAS